MWSFFNELLFITQAVVIALFALGSLFFGRTGPAALVVVSALLSNILIRKQIMLFGLEVVACDALIIGSDLAIHLIYEYYGKKEAEKTIGLYLYTSLFFIFISTAFLLFIPSLHDTAQVEYLAVLRPMPWIMTVSCLVGLATKGINLSLYHLFSVWWKNERFITKTLLALLISQLFDTIAFTYIALSGSVFSTFNIIIFSYGVKCLAIVCAVPFITLCRSFLPFKTYKDS